jgi:hypothetical protein
MRAISDAQRAGSTRSAPLRSVAPPSSRIASLAVSWAWQSIASPAAWWTETMRAPSRRSSSITVPWPATRGTSTGSRVIPGRSRCEESGGHRRPQTAAHTYPARPRRACRRRKSLHVRCPVAADTIGMNDFHIALLWLRSLEIVIGHSPVLMLSELEMHDLFVRYRSPYKA